MAGISSFLKLQSILGQEEATSLNSQTATKLEEYLKNKDKEVEELNNEIKQLSASSEQSSFQRDRELVSSQTKLAETIQNLENVRGQLTELDLKHQEERRRNDELRESHQNVLAEMQNLKSTVNGLNSDKLQLSDLLGKKELENQKLNEDMLAIQNELSKVISSKYEFMAKAEDLELKIVNIQHENRKLESEKELQRQQISSLNDELAQKSRDILQLRKEKSSQVLELQAELDEKTEATRVAQELVNTLKKQVQEKDKKIYEFAVKLKESQENSLSMEEEYNKEIQALTKLRDLHKKNSEDNQNKINELVKTIEDMHKLLKETGQANSELEKSFEDTQLDCRNKLEEKEEEIESLKKELKNINDLLAKSKLLGFTEEGVETLFPNAAATSKILKSGMTLTEIYSELVKTQSDLQTEKYEKQKLHNQLKQILDEIEEKTPLFNKKMEEYQTALETITGLRNQLTEALSDQERLQSERDDAVRKCQYYKREVERTKSLASDLSLQVRNLLREIEEANGGQIIDDNEQGSGDSTAGSVITQHLVTFKDLKEMQEKNQQLLVVVRDLSEQLEENDRKNSESSCNELQEKLNDSLKQLEELKDERKHQTVLLESIIRQKELYKSMASQHSMGQSMEASFSSSTPKVGAGRFSSFNRSTEENQINLNETQGALKQLQEEFDNYKKEKQSDYSTLSDQLNKFRDELSEARIQNAKLNNELDYIREKAELAQSKAESYEKEVTILRENSRQYSSSSIQHQQTINTLRQDLISTREQLAKAENTVQNLQAERELLKATEIRLLQEKESIIREQHSNSRVISNLQAVQNNLQRMESEAKLAMQKRIENLEQEIVVYKNKLESEAEKYQAAVKSWDEKNEDMRAKMLVEVGKSNKTHEELVEAYSQLHQTKLELSTIQSKFSAAQNKLSRMPVGTGESRIVSNEVKSLQTQLNEAKSEITALKQKLETAQKSADNHRDRALQLESHVKEESLATTQLIQSLEKSLKEKEEEIARFEIILKETEQENSSLKEEMVKLTLERDQLMKNIDARKHELDKSLLLVQQAKEIQQDAERDKQEQARLVSEAQECYQRELMLHSADVQELTSLRDQVQGIRNELLAAVEERDKLEASVIANRESFEEREKITKKEAEIMSQKLTDLQAQNEALYQQLEVMSGQLAAMKSSDWAKNDDKPADNSPEHLMEVIRYLRKEKEIALTQNETTAAECGRFKMKTEILERRITEVERDLKEERERANLIAATETQHQELLKKVEMLNLLQESNRLIRDEKEAAVRKNAELEARVKQLEVQLGPLQKNLQDSVSQLDVVNAECVALRQEVKRWQNRASQLLEQSRKHDPEDFKKLQEENSNLKTQVNSLNEEKQRLKTELTKQSVTLADLQKELANLQEVIQKEKENVSRLEAESSEHQRTTIQVKKIARKYKTEYTDLKTQYDDMATKMNTSDENTAAQAAKEQQLRQEMQNELETKTKEANNKAAKAIEELEKLKEEVARLTKSDENSKGQEERLRRLILQMKKKLAQIQTERDNFCKEKGDQEKELEELKTKLSGLEQSSEEENLRASTVKSQYEAKISKMEKEMKAMKESKERLEKQVEELTRLKQSARPSTSAGLVERASSTISEPPLIRPLTPPMVSSVRHPSHSLQTSSSARSTPTASIRPMAIGSAASTNVVASHASSSRTATVTPTSAIPSSEADNVPITMAHVLPQSVPQATVQPTPANVATVTIAPSTNEQIVGEVASSVSDSADTVFVTAVPRFRQSELPSTQQQQDDSRVGPSEAEDSCSSSVVSVSVVSTSPQTQVVTPTVKRPREEQEPPQSSVITRETDSPDTTGASSSSSPQVKRIRIVGDTTLTIERASVVTSGAHQMESTPTAAAAQSSKTTQEEVMPERPGVIVTPEPQATPVPSESTNNQTTQEAAAAVSVTDQVSTEPQYSNTQQAAISDDQSETKPKTSGELSEVDESKKNYPEDEYIEEDDDGEVEEVMEDEGPEGDYDDEETMQDPQEVDDDDMIGIDDTDGNSDEAEIGDDMDADGPSNSCHSTTVTGDNVPTSTQQDIPSAMVTGSTSSSVSSAIITTNVGGTSSLSSSGGDNQDVIVPHHRPAILPRVPQRTERIPSTGRQHLTPFSIPGQSGTFEEGDDSIVPSTPTLFVQGRADGFAEAVSSPQVPQGRFLFTSESGNQPGICQLATQGALGVDDTRMDLSQFDEGSGRSVPTTPLQVSPPADATSAELVVESSPASQSQSQLTDQQVTSTRTIPTIMVNTPSEESTEEATEKEVIEETSLTIEEIKDEVSVSETTPVVEGIVEEGGESSLATQSNPVVEHDGSGDVSGDSASNKGQPQRKPITWDSSKGASSGGSSGAPASSTVTPPPSVPPPAPHLPFSGPSPRARSIDTSQRGRRLRIRGSGNYVTPRGGSGQRGNWSGGYWRGRGRGGPPMS